MSAFSVFYKDESGAIFHDIPVSCERCATMIRTKPAAEARFGGHGRSARCGRAGGVASSVGTVLCAVLLPKCPLCVAAWLGAAGLGAGAATLVAPFVRPAALLLAALVLLALAWSFARALSARIGPARGQERCACAATADDPGPMVSSPGCVRRG
jgi:hypothetical protein